MNELLKLFSELSNGAFEAEKLLDACRDRLRRGTVSTAELLDTFRDAVRSGHIGITDARLWCATLGLGDPVENNIEQPTLLRSIRSTVTPIGRGTRLLNGKFELQEQLGGGGMGVVYRALDLEAVRLNDPNPHVALKVLNQEFQVNPQATLALQREASRARRLDHSNIIRVYEYYHDQGVHFLTMELLQGSSWADLLEEHPHGLELAAALPMIEQLCAALSYAHHQGVVHSDLKPANLFLTTDHRVKVLDFGIAAPLRKVASAVEETRFNPRRLGALSESYACPEMWHGLDADPRDDVYSLACVVYELLSGRRPYGTATSAQALDRKLTPPPIDTLSAMQNSVLCHALILHRTERTQSVDQFFREFTRKGASRRRYSRTVAVAAFAGAAAVALGWLLIHTARTTPSQNDSRVDGAQAAELLHTLGITDRRFQFGSRQPRALLLDDIRRLPRSIQLGSTAADLDDALALCRRSRSDCEPSWYADERLRTVVLHPFELDVAPVTIGDFQRFVEEAHYITAAERSGGAYALQDEKLQWIAGGSWRNAVGSSPTTADSAVVGVNYEDAERYCQWRGGRLPTEDEWEYVARGPTRQIFPWGNDTTPAQSRIDQRPRATSGPPEGIGGRYRGLARNVWQWVDTRDGLNRILKGASWLESNPANLRAASRRQELPTRADSDTGFRCARAVEMWPDVDDQLTLPGGPHL